MVEGVSGISTTKVTPTSEAVSTSESAKSGQAADLAGVAALQTSGSSTYALTMQAPNIDASSMMLALSALQKMTIDSTYANVSSAIESQRVDILAFNEKRAKEMKAYFENMEKASRPKKAGFFGIIIKFFKTLFKSIAHPSEAKELWSDFGKLLKNSIGNIIKDLLTLVIAAAAIALTGGGAAFVFVASIGFICSVGSMIASDPAIIDLAMEGKTPEEQAKISKIFMGFSIAFMVVSAICSITCAVGAYRAGSEAMSAAQKTIDMVNRGISATKAIVLDGVGGAVQSVDSYYADRAKVAAMLNTANSEQGQAEIAEAEKLIDDKIKTLSDLLAIEQKIIESTASLLSNIASGNKAAAIV